MNVASKKIITIVIVSLLTLLVSTSIFSSVDRYEQGSDNFDEFRTNAEHPAGALSKLESGALGSSAIQVEDSTGKKITLDGPANKVATLGYGFTRTVIDLGGKDLIMAYDTYSQDVVDEYGIIGENIGSAYSSNKDVIVASMILLGEGGKFNKATDVVILNDYSGTIADEGTREFLEDDGFKVLCFGAQDYDDVLFIVENIAKVIGKESSEALNKMRDVKDTAYKLGMEINPEDKVTAMYVNTYSGTMRIYNTGIATSMIEMAGGVNIGYNKDILSNYYAAEASTILELYPHVVFLDGNYPMTAEEFQKDVLKTDTIHVIKMEKDWNNYCPSVADGLMVVSAAMLDDYPDRSEDEITFPYTMGEVLVIVAVTISVLLGLLVMRHD